MWTPDNSVIITAEQKADTSRSVAIASYKAAFDAHLDNVAQGRGYDNRLTITTYLGSTNEQWNAEAETYIAWRDNALAYMFERLESGETPTVDQFISGIKAIKWPNGS